MTIDILNTTGVKVSTMSLPKSVFEVEVKPEVLTQALRVYIDRQHQGSKDSLTRGEINRTTSKVWRQKGTGNARHGSRRAPIFVGGGVAFGPHQKSAEPLTLNKKFKKIALVGALSLQAKQKNLIVIDSTKGFDGKTKTTQSIFAKLAGYAHSGKDHILLVLPTSDKSCIQSCRNLPGLTVSQAKRINVYEIISSQKIILVKDSIAILENTFAKKEITKPTN